MTDGKFDLQLSNGIDEFLIDMKSTSEVIKMNAYKRFYINPNGMYLAADIERRISYEPEILDILIREVKKYNEFPIDGYKLAMPNTQKTFRVEYIFEQFSKILHDYDPNFNVVIEKVFNPTEWYNSFWNLFGYQLPVEQLYVMTEYKIVEGIKYEKCYGQFYLELTEAVHPCIDKLQDGTCKISSLANFNLFHELVHVLQYSYGHIDKAKAEILAIRLESEFRKQEGHPFTDNYKRKTFALAIADLISVTPMEFNSNYEKYGNIKNAYDVCSRMWHYSHYIGKYYGYALGLLSNNR